MATALDLIKRAQRLLGVYSIGEDPNADEAQDGLQSLNSMLDLWANQNLLVHAKSEDVIPLAANQASVTVGPTGSFVTTRPVTIDASSYVVYQQVSYPLELLTQQDYNNISLKGLVIGIPCSIWCWMKYPDITITPWPIPAASMDLHLWSNKLIKSFPNLTTDVDLPPGYEKALAFSLAEEIAPEYQIPVPQQVTAQASSARRLIKRSNAEIPRMDMPYGIPGNGYGYWDNWYL